MTPLTHDITNTNDTTDTHDTTDTSDTCHSQLTYEMLQAEEADIWLGRVPAGQTAGYLDPLQPLATHKDIHSRIVDTCTLSIQSTH